MWNPPLLKARKELELHAPSFMDSLMLILEALDEDFWPAQALDLIRQIKENLRPHREKVAAAYAWLLDAEALAWVAVRDIEESEAQRSLPSTEENVVTEPWPDELEWLVNMVALRHADRPRAELSDYVRRIWAGGSLPNRSAHRAAELIRSLGYAVDLKWNGMGGYQLQIKRTSNVIHPTELDLRMRREAAFRLTIRGAWPRDSKHPASWWEIKEEIARRRRATHFGLDPNDEESTWEKIQELDADGDTEAAELCQFVSWFIRGDDDIVDDER